MLLFGKSKKATVKTLNELKIDSDLYFRFVTLQNEININHDTKVLAVAGVDDDLLTAAFAKALALAYSYNNSPTLIIDANMYNPCLKDVLGDFLNFYDSTNRSYSVPAGFKTAYIYKNLDAVCFEKQTYPTNVFKSKIIQQIISRDYSKYEHFVIITPSIKDHKEVELLRDVVKSIVLVTQRNTTKKKDIFETISFFKESELPLAKTVIIA